MFYKVVVLEFIDHPKGVLVETGIILDPNYENRKDIETIFEEQKGFLMGMFLLGIFDFVSFFVLRTDLDREKRINLQNTFEEQFGKVREYYKLGDFGKFEFGPFSFYVEEMKAAPHRFEFRVYFPSTK